MNEVYFNQLKLWTFANLQQLTFDIALNLLALRTFQWSNQNKAIKSNQNNGKTNKQAFIWNLTWQIICFKNIID